MFRCLNVRLRGQSVIIQSSSVKLLELFKECCKQECNNVYLSSPEDVLEFVRYLHAVRLEIDGDVDELRAGMTVTYKYNYMNVDKYFDNIKADAILDLPTKVQGIVIEQMILKALRESE